MPKDLKEVVFELGANMLQLAGKGDNIEENKFKILETIKSGSAYNKLLEMVQNQDGDISYLEDTTKFEESKYIEPVYCKKTGYIHEMNAKKIGKIACDLGAGRITKEDKIDTSVGIVLTKKIGDFAKKDEILAYIHSNSMEKMKKAKSELEEIIKIKTE